MSDGIDQSMHARTYCTLLPIPMYIYCSSKNMHWLYINTLSKQGPQACRTTGNSYMGPVCGEGPQSLLSSESAIYEDDYIQRSRGNVCTKHFIAWTLGIPWGQWMKAALTKVCTVTVTFPRQRAGPRQQPMARFPGKYYATQRQRETSARKSLSKVAHNINTSHAKLC